MKINGTVGSVVREWNDRNSNEEDWNGRKGSEE